MPLGVNIEKAVSHGLELVAIEILARADKMTPISTGKLRRSSRYEVEKPTIINLISGEGYNEQAQQNVSEYVSAQYFGDLRHAGDFKSGLKSIIDRYAGKLTTGGKWRARYSTAWKLADKDGYLQIQPEGAPRWFERAYFMNKRLMQKIFASAFRPGAYK